MRHAIKIGYDGTRFNGFAIQPEKRTVEGEVLNRLIKSKIIKGRRENKFQYAARTDKGVSAFGNVISFNSKGNPLKVLEGMMDIWITGYAVVDKNFNARHSKCKIYRYYLINHGYSIKKMRMAAKLMEGEHDFSAFSKKDGREKRRKIEKIEIKGGKIIKMDFYAPSFLWNQVRRMAAALARVGEREAAVEDVERALHGERINFGIMPPENLILLDVIYEDVDFEIFVPDSVILRKEIYKDGFNYLYAPDSRNVGRTKSMGKVC